MSIKASDLTTADRMNMENAGLSEDRIAAFCDRIYDMNHMNSVRLAEFFSQQQDVGLLSFFVHDENTNTRRRRTGVLVSVTDKGIGIHLFKDQGTAHALYDEFWSDFTTTGEINAAMYDMYRMSLDSQCELDVTQSHYSFSEIVNPQHNLRPLTHQQLAQCLDHWNVSINVPNLQEHFSRIEEGKQTSNKVK